MRTNFKYMIGFTVFSLILIGVIFLVCLWLVRTASPSATSQAVIPETSNSYAGHSSPSSDYYPSTATYHPDTTQMEPITSINTPDSYKPPTKSMTSPHTPHTPSSKPVPPSLLNGGLPPTGPVIPPGIPNISAPPKKPIIRSYIPNITEPTFSRGNPTADFSTPIDPPVGISQSK